ncbi:MAG: hypothetical protein NVSMB32_01740 [Actinomycetota bacterium]
MVKKEAEVAEETQDAGHQGGTADQKPKDTGGKTHGLPLSEATPEARKQWKEDLMSSGKYTPGASLKDLIAGREGIKSGSED